MSEQPGAAADIRAIGGSRLVTMDIRDVLRFRDRVARLNDQLSSLLVSAGSDWGQDSPARADAVALDHAEPIRTAVSQSVLLIESAGEHVAAATNALREPAQVLACFSCVRTATEVASIAWWLLDPTVGSIERVSRSVALRRKGLDEQRRFLAESPEHDGGGLSGRYAALDEGVGKLGLHRVVVPSATDLVGRVFGDRKYYRLGSSVVHGHPWALIQVGYADLGKRKEGIVPMQKTAKPIVLVFLMTLALEAVARPVWALTRYAGSNRVALENLLESAYRELNVRERHWFWQSPAGGPVTAATRL